TAAGASQSQQIAVAQRVLAGQGIGAWPVCGANG
ncbi:MAG TPA: transglycosylase family protein, partial [Streptosporangiaceae bacterium]|nr:transglycosylase family protein [Streptosporangiaceae bacterium]